MITDLLDGAWRELLTLVENQPKFSNTLESIKWGKSVWPTFVDALSRSINSDADVFATVRDYCKWLGRAAGIKVTCVKNNRYGAGLYINAEYSKYVLFPDGRLGRRFNDGSAHYIRTAQCLSESLEYLARDQFKRVLQSHQIDPHCHTIAIYDGEANWV